MDGQRGGMMSRTSDRTARFCERFALTTPILLAPMAGVPAPALSIAVASAGGLGGCGALLMSPQEISGWASEVRRASGKQFQINLWIPDPAPARNAAHEAALRDFLSGFGPPVPPEAAERRPPDFTAQCAALLAAAPAAASSIMGLFPAAFATDLRRNDIAWFATVTTVAEARAAEAAGADALIAQGSEAGGHRGCFDALEAEHRQVGLMSLLPAIVDAVRVPVIAAGGVADARGIAAALLLGASAVQIGTAFLRCPESGIAAAWASALERAAPEDTLVSRVFSGRAGRSLATDYVRAALAPGAPAPAPYPVQRGLTAAMRRAAAEANDLARMQAWAGQSASLGRSAPATQLVRELWAEARALLAESYGA
jgi:nitronate monooxygenase